MVEVGHIGLNDCTYPGHQPSLYFALRHHLRSLHNRLQCHEQVSWTVTLLTHKSNPPHRRSFCQVFQQVIYKEQNLFWLTVLEVTESMVTSICPSSGDGLVLGHSIVKIQSGEVGVYRGSLCSRTSKGRCQAHFITCSRDT